MFEAIVWFCYAALLLISAGVAASMGISGGREGRGIIKTWMKAWIRITKTASLLASILLLLGLLVVFAEDPGDAPEMLILFVVLPVGLATIFLPSTGIGAVIGYNFGAQRRAREDITRSQEAAQIMAEASQSELSPASSRPRP